MTNESLISLPGNSSAIISIKSNDAGDLIVEKTCTGSHAERLVRQANKQLSFVNKKRIRTPRITNLFTEQGLTKLEMEYIKGQDLVNFTTTSGKEAFVDVIGQIIDFILQEFNESVHVEFPIRQWSTKVEDVLSKLPANFTEKQDLEKCLLQNLPETLLVGPCHGDLTFSNCIVERNGNLCIFDFLDPPIETPYEDAAKFLQDAQFFWSLQKFKGECDKTKVKIYWSFAEKLLKSKLKSYCNPDTLEKFQVLGLLRIIPYTRDEETLRFLHNSIRGILNATTSTLCR